jgi:protein-disulfide isomerase
MKHCLNTILFVALMAGTSIGWQTAVQPVPASRLANLAAAPVVSIIEFADFQCPFCARTAPQLRKLQDEYRGKVQIVFKNFPLSFHSRSKPAHLAALAAGEQGKFWEMHDLIFSHPGHLADSDFDAYAEQLGLDKDRFHTAMHSTLELDKIDSDIAEGKEFGVTGTPTLIVDGHKIEGARTYAYLKRVVESRLNGEDWPNNATAQPAERVAVKTNGAPSLGAPSAPLTIVEFSDFQCPYCAGAAAALEKMVADNPGKIRLVYKNFPLDFHADAPLAHRAAAAAGVQGKFWEMHDLIFQHQRAIKRADLLGFATELKLDISRFERDLNDPDLKANIDADREEGANIGVTGTPTFVVNGKMISGFSEPEFRAMIARESGNGTIAESEDINKESLATLPHLDLSIGPRDAPVSIQWYVDLGSPLTARSAVALQRYIADHSGKVQVQFRNFPLSNHDGSMLLHEFVLAAAAQGKFWQTEALLLADSNTKDRNELKLLATQAGLDQKKLWLEVDAAKYAPLISRDLVSAKELGIAGTPTFVVGRKKLDGVNGLKMLDKN